MAFPIENFFTPNITNILITFVIPFLLFFTILFVVIKKTKIFGNSNIVYLIISLGLTIMIYAVNPGHVFQFLASYLLQISVAGIVISLVGIIAVFFFALIRTGVKLASTAGQMKLESVLKEERDLEKKIRKEHNVDKRIQMIEHLEELERKKRAFMYRK